MFDSNEIYLFSLLTFGKIPKMGFWQNLSLESGLHRARVSNPISRPDGLGFDGSNERKPRFFQSSPPAHESKGHYLRNIQQSPVCEMKRYRQPNPYCQRVTGGVIPSLCFVIESVIRHHNTLCTPRQSSAQSFVLMGQSSSLACWWCCV